MILVFLSGNIDKTLQFNLQVSEVKLEVSILNKIIITTINDNEVQSQKLVQTFPLYLNELGTEIFL